MGLCLLEVSVVLAENHLFIGGTTPDTGAQFINSHPKALCLSTRLVLVHACVRVYVCVFFERTQGLFVF